MDTFSMKQYPFERNVFKQRRSLLHIIYSVCDFVDFIVENNEQWRWNGRSQEKIDTKWITNGIVL